ncbi:MAG TPA: MBL fold metallo-hydrolase [Actinomycetes bacterium]|nr:MBL fold metallo-hydrolase [Actinomycetes bacterium]
MLVVGFPAAAFDTNCFVVAPAAGADCVVVDPGVGVDANLDAVLREHRLRPVAVLLTHGHLDHTFSVTPVCGARGITAYIHPADRELLADPAKGFGPGLLELFGGRLTWTEPADVAPLVDGGVVELAGLSITVDHAPGHTRGSVLFRLPGSAPAEPRTVLSGDVLFAGSIGRTDLPGGDYPTMLRSLATKILPLADDTVVLPGHGPRTTIGRERVSNPFLQEAKPLAAPARGL